jgi:hypothetical protein
MQTNKKKLKRLFIVKVDVWENTTIFQYEKQQQKQNQKMKNLAIKISLCIMAFAVMTAGAQTVKTSGKLGKNQKNNTLTEAEKKEGWTLLFDGKTTDGWHGYNMKVFPDCWTIEDESLTMNSKGGGESLDVLTNKEYRNFRLAVDYKLTKAANSGVIFQIYEDPKYKFPYETGPEFQVIDHENWPDKLEDWQINGANYAMYPPKARPYKPVGAWNNLVLEVKGNQVKQFLNGKLVVQYEKNSEEWLKLRNSGKWVNFPDWGKFDEGFISLQNHGTKVWYRNIKIKEL